MAAIEVITNLGVDQVLISTPIQLFIAWRVRVVTGSLLLPFMISLFAMCSLGRSLYYLSATIADLPCIIGGGISVTTIVTLRPRFAQFGQFHPEVITWLVSSATCDVFLTGSLVYSLVRALPSPPSCEWH